jgi:peptidylprolyl isomerase
MRQAKTGDTVKVHYTGRLSDGSVFDTSENREPLEFILGGGRLIAGFDEAVVGMSADESKTVMLTTEKAYGPYNQEMVMVVDRTRMPSDVKPEVGQNFQIPGPNGNTLFVIVKDVSDATVTFDANHPLAGKDLTFDIQLVEIA